MAIYWTLKSIPELSQLTAKERRLAWRRTYLSTFHHWQTWMGMAGCAACAALGSYLGILWGHSLLGAAVGGGVGGFVFSQASIYVARLHYSNILLGNNR
ncbi:hypothetical protein [Paraburkholderia megapolitana]|uniref:hypothetical protein n=1 Tax=Paraburkholderia megapolitana TaxID=420953 RepID=UPI0038BC06F7